jgi:cation diffusion facilitator CzcD-associated flavoprotein CzcO
LESSTGQRWSAQFVVEGVGLLSSTNVPDFPGQSSFGGEIYHTARWPEHETDFTGKRVGVIGTGSSGVQVISEIAPQCGHLTVFQRTPQYIVPAQHRPLDPHLLERIDADYEGYWRTVLASVTAFGFDESSVSAGDVTAAEREAVFEDAWNSGGGFQFMFATFNDIGTSREANDAATAFIRRKIADVVTDPAVAERLTPHDLYAKRPICCDDYYETYNRDNVTLVDAKAHPIVEITASGIRTDDAEYELDVIIFATGFDAVTGNYLKIDNRGRAGVSLRDRWKDRPHTHLGLMSADFPNLFMIFGPMGPFTNQPPAHEVQVNWVAEAIAHVRELGMDTIEPTRAAEDQWLSTCDEIAHATLFPQVDSWINGANIPGKPIAVMFYMAGMGAYMEHLQRAVDTGYADFRLDASSVPA